MNTKIINIAYDSIDRLRIDAIQRAAETYRNPRLLIDRISAGSIILTHCSVLKIDPSPYLSLNTNEIDPGINNSPKIDQHQCPKCNRVFKTSHALCGHQIAHRNR